MIVELIDHMAFAIGGIGVFVIAWGALLGPEFLVAADVINPNDPQAFAEGGCCPRIDRWDSDLAELLPELGAEPARNPI